MASMELIIAGFGGQGILFLGEMLTKAAILEGKHATWMPAYGPEQRGGTATCTVVIAEEPIGSPVAADPDALIVMNRPSMDKFEPRARPGAVLIVNAAMVDRSPERADLVVVAVDAAAEAKALDKPQVANMVLLGALLAVRPVVAIESVARALADHFPPDRQHLVEINVTALTRGAAAAARQLPGAASARVA
jgi:2-oxoglutarate ferredoxin oxidoreductase subunit gamma